MHYRVGTSGWHYAHWRSRFYPEDLPTSQWLGYYAHHFDTVEINNSFYRLPSGEALETWRTEVPEGFLFAAKASRYLTHMKKLKDPEQGLATFMPRIETLDDKLGPILFQLPPHWRCNPERLAEFLAALPPGHRYAFELRDPSWHRDDVYVLLERHGAACCWYELAGTQVAGVVTADFLYVRLHGPLGAYQGRYDSRALSQWIARIEACRTRDCYVYFDNDEQAFAVSNAREFKAMVSP